MSRVATLQVCDQVVAIGQGKSAFLGLYGHEIIVPQVPFTIPQLFFVISFRATLDDIPTELRVRIERPGHPPFTVDRSEPLRQSIPKEPAADARFFQMTVIERVAPFEITETGTMRVFVEDEGGEHYASGVRMKIGVLPEQSLPLIGNAGILTAAHFQRVKESHPEYANRLADQLLESFTSHIRVLGQEPRLPAPDQELRVQLDQKHVHVFFPAPIDPPPEVVVESPGETARVSVIFVDELGFIAEFDPAVPPDLAFPFLTSVPEPSRKRITSTKKKRN